MLYCQCQFALSQVQCFYVWELSFYRDCFVHAPSQWETMLQCNVVSHWLGACTKLSRLYYLWSWYVISSEVYVMCSCWCLVGMLRPCIPEFHGNKTDLLMYLFVEFYFWYMYCETYNISHTLVGNEIVDHSDVVGASPVGAAPTTSSFSFFII